jgi:hypothetical protein
MLRACVSNRTGNRPVDQIPRKTKPSWGGDTVSTCARLKKCVVGRTPQQDHDMGCEVRRTTLSLWGVRGAVPMLPCSPMT